MPRNTAAWASLPGNFDALNLDPMYGVPPSENPDGIPTLTPGITIDPQWQWVALDQSVRVSPAQRPTTVVHAFVDDYRLEALWNRAKAAEARFEGFAAICTPDYSLYPEWPSVLNRYNTYRSRWCGAWWQRCELPVIPTVSWADARSFDYAFIGIAPASPVVVRTPDWRKPDVVAAFTDGYIAMCEALAPSCIWMYGTAGPRYVQWRTTVPYSDVLHSVASRRVGRPVSTTAIDED